MAECFADGSDFRRHLRFTYDAIECKARAWCYCCRHNPESTRFLGKITSIFAYRAIEQADTDMAIYLQEYQLLADITVHTTEERRYKLQGKAYEYVLSDVEILLFGAQLN